MKIKNPRLQCTACYKTFYENENTEFVTKNGFLEWSNDVKKVTKCPHCKSVNYIVV